MRSLTPQPARCEPPNLPSKSPSWAFPGRGRSSCSSLPSLPHATAQKHGVEIAQLITLPSPMVRGTTGLSWWWLGCSGAPPPRALHPKLGQAGHRAPLLPVQGRWRCRLMKHAGSSTKTSLTARQEHRGTADKQGQRVSESSARLGRVPEEVPGGEMEARALHGERGCPKYPEQRREGAPCLPHSRQRDSLCVQDVSLGGNPGPAGRARPLWVGAASSSAASLQHQPCCPFSPKTRRKNVTRGEEQTGVCAKRRLRKEGKRLRTARSHPAAFPSRASPPRRGVRGEKGAGGASAVVWLNPLPLPSLTPLGASRREMDAGS